MQQLPKIEDCIEIVQDKYSDEFGRSLLRTRAMELPRRLPGFYYRSLELDGDDYNLVEMDKPLGKTAKHRTVTIPTEQSIWDEELSFGGNQIFNEVGNNIKWEDSETYMSKQSIEEQIFFSSQERHYPTGYDFRTQYPKFEEGKSCLVESLKMLKVANRKLASFDAEINRLTKLQGSSASKNQDCRMGLGKNGRKQFAVDPEISCQDGKDFRAGLHKKQSSLDSSSLATSVHDMNVSMTLSTEAPQGTKAIAEYYFYNADMKRVLDRTKPGIDETPVLISPYVTDPAKAEEAFLLRHYGAASVMNIRPHSMFEVSDNKEISEQHMENVVYRQSRKYGFMFDRRTKIRQRQRKGKRNVSPIKSASHAAAIAAGYSESFSTTLPMHLRSPTSPHPLSPSRGSSPLNTSLINGGGIRPLLNTRHVSLIFRDISSSNMINGKSSEPINFSEAIRAATQIAELDQNGELSATSTESGIPILDIDTAIHVAATTLAASLAQENISEELPLSARRHKADDVFGDSIVTRLNTPTLRQSLSMIGSPSRSLSRRISRHSSRSILLVSPEKQSFSASPGHQGSVSGSPSASSPQDSKFSNLFPASPVCSETCNDVDKTPCYVSSPHLIDNGIISTEDRNGRLSASALVQSSSETPPNTEVKKLSFSEMRPAPLVKEDSMELISSPGNMSLLKIGFSPNRRASFSPAISRTLQAPPTILEEPSLVSANESVESVSKLPSPVKSGGEFKKEVPWDAPPELDYLTLMVERPEKAVRKPSIAFSFNPTSGKIEDIHFQSLQPKQRPHSADLDKSTQRSLLRRLQEKSKAAYEYMRQQRRAKLLHHGKDLSKICKITSDEAEQERASLVELFETCGGRFWSRKDNWCSERPIREWYGVSVNVEGFVFELHLSNNNLAGPFPDSIMYLTRLEVINLDYNQLSGDIPEYALQKLLNLTILSVRHNKLSGYIKFDLLAQLSSLREIWLSDNEFIGDIQDGIAYLAALTHIDLDNNRLTGSIPRHINRLFNLQHLSLGRNRLTGHIPPSIMSLDRLETLSIYSNQLTGKIPLWLKSMPALQDLLVFDNNFDTD
jgi:hypothetical protein